MKLFIVDDSEILRNHLSDILYDIEGIEIIGEAANTIDGIESVQQLKPDCAIVDIRIPGEGGIYLLENIKKFDKNIIVIIFTNYPYPQYRKRCLERGADYFFEKSKELEKMLETLKKIRDEINIYRAEEK